jgi:maltooligosyltrehalose synthase
VDYAARAAALEQWLADWQRDAPGTVRRAREQWRSGAIKLLTIAVLLAYRREHPGLFETGGYEPLALGESLGGFVRDDGGQALVVTFRRYPLAGEPAGFALPDLARGWQQLLTREAAQARGEFDAVSAGLPFAVFVASRTK